MDFDVIKTFLQVMELNNFTKSAEILFCTQAAVSIRIRKLEKYLGVQLFERTGKAIIPTDAAKAFHPYAVKILKTLDQGRDIARDSQLLSETSIKITSSHTPGGYLLPKLIYEFNHEYPNIHITNHVQYSKRVIRDIENQVYDLGFISQPQKVDQSVLDLVPLIDDPLAIVVSHDHPWAKRKSIEISELAEERFLLSNPNSTLIDYIQLKGNCSLRKKNMVVMGNLEAIKQSVHNNFGVSILSKFSVATEINHGLLTEVTLEDSITLTRKIFYAKRKGHELSPTLTRFLESVKASCLLRNV